jgi:hypothetical protein
LFIVECSQELTGGTPERTLRKVARSFLHCPPDRQDQGSDGIRTFLQEGDRHALLRFVPRNRVIAKIGIENAALSESMTCLIMVICMPIG